jgi:hypothetical protein
MHAMSAHGMKETSAEMERKTRESIKPVRVEVK